MRSFTYLTAISILSLWQVGCGPSNPVTDAKVNKAKEKVADAQDAATAATKATADAALAKRDDFAKEMSNQLEQLNSKYEALKTQAIKADAQAKKELDKKLEIAKTKRDHAANQLTELKSATADRWEKVKTGVSNAFEDLKKVFE